MADTDLVDHDLEPLQDSRQDVISKAITEHGGFEDEEPKVDPPEETPEQKAERDEKGRFKAKAPDDSEAIEEPEKPKREYPKSWPKDLREKLDPFYQAAPDEFVDLLSKRDQDIENGFKQIGNIKQFYDEMNSVIQPYMPTINALGMSPAKAIHGLLNADHVLRTASPDQKQQYMLRLAKNYGVTLDNLPKDENPEVTKLYDEINQLKHQLQLNQQQSEQNAYQPYVQEITQFAQTHEHFEDLRPIIALVLESGRASTLEDAYNIALRTQENQPVDLDQERKKWQEEYERELKAKAAAASVKGSGPSNDPPSHPNDRRAQIAAAMNSR